MLDKLSNEIIRCIMNKLGIFHIKNMNITHSSINKLNYKYFLLSYKIFYKFFSFRVQPKYIFDEIKDWIYYFDYSLIEYINDLASIFDDFKSKKKYVYKNIIPIEYNINIYNLDKIRYPQYTKVHPIYNNLTLGVYNKIKKYNYNLLALL